MATVSIQVTVPDAAVPKIRAAFGGGTNAQTLAAVQAWAGPILGAAIRAEVLRRNLEARLASAVQAANAAQAAVNAASEDEQAQLEGVWAG